ncbi:hypothetical protein HH310_29535 [Actinoplanes sp. TBRC 11911]|uniref:hypothetical protein n=1 Tax=Actinoplanes sp. TBRC 11911 TaxID=2729386 RepID=UPI00145CE6AE|nr:hypothetical protein [Actinoplanes sp. TBRC 11911]NMO55314.1 hypothetical protein [Actinoplanes sp. TBRC 11911]
MTVTLIGGEMPLWSDLDATHGPAPAGGAALRPLLGAVFGRTLVAGPHDPELIAALPVDDVTVLVRSESDAAVLDRYAVLCGSLDKVPAVAAYDTVVALDGLDRLISAEAPDRSWDEVLSMVAALVRPGGRLLLAVENPFGLHRLVTLPGELSDADWVVAEGPGGPEVLRGRLAAAGLTVVHDFATYPDMRLSEGEVSPSQAGDRWTRDSLAGAPAAGGRRSLPAEISLLSDSFAKNRDLSGFVEARLSAAMTAAKDVLADPRRLATGAARAGLVSELAPGWIVLAGKGQAAEARTAIWPDAITVVDGAVREIRLPDPSLPRGRTLEDLLLTACRRRDLPAVRELLTAWLSGPAAGVPAGQIVVDAAGRHAGLTPAADPLVTLREFAADVIRGGYADLWPAPIGEAELTALLAGMTGRELEPADVPAAAGPRAAESVRELTTERDRLAKELAEARAKHEWYESMLRNREAELKRVRQINKVLKATMPGRAATSLYGGLRAGKRAVRGVVKKAKG